MVLHRFLLRQRDTIVIERDKTAKPLRLGGFEQMPIQQWSDKIVVVALRDDPQLTDELNSLTEQLEQGPPLDVVLDMRGVSHIDSSNIGKLLRVRKVVIAKERRVFLTGISTQVSRILQIVCLDQLFDVADQTSHCSD